MKIAGLLLICAVFICVPLNPVRALRAVRVKEVAFKGISVLSFLDIINRTRTQDDAGQLIIDLDSLEKALSGLAPVKSYSIEQTGGSLIVTVKEKKISARIVLIAQQREGYTFFDIDDDYTGIEKNRIYGISGPSLLMAEDKKSQYTVISVTIMRFLAEIRSSFPDLYREIEAIQFFHRNYIQVVLYNRKTTFLAGLNINDFRRMRIAASYCDSRGKYPRTVDLRTERIPLSYK